MGWKRDRSTCRGWTCRLRQSVCQRQHRENEGVCQLLPAGPGRVSGLLPVPAVVVELACLPHPHRSCRPLPPLRPSASEPLLGVLLFSVLLTSCSSPRLHPLWLWLRRPSWLSLALLQSLLPHPNYLQPGSCQDRSARTRVEGSYVV